MNTLLCIADGTTGPEMLQNRRPRSSLGGRLQRDVAHPLRWVVSNEGIGI